MKMIIIAIVSIVMSSTLISCHTTQKDDKNNHRWSKPQGVLEGCDGVMRYSEQCKQNPDNLQYLYEIHKTE